MQLQCLWNGGNVLGEGPLWDHRSGTVFWVDIVGQQLFCLDWASKKVNQFAMPDAICSLALHPKGLFAAFADCFALIAWPNVDVLQQTLSLIDPKQQFNDGKTDPSGRFWIASKDRSEQNPIAKLYALDNQEAQLQTKERGLTVGNGIAWSSCQRKMYLTDSPNRVIYQYDFDASSGNISNQQVFTRISDDAGYPDGLTIDSDDYIWSAHFSGSRITRYRPDGSVDRVIELPIPYPTSCCFAGPDLDTLVITSATRDLTDAERAQSPQSGGLFALKLNNHHGVKSPLVQLPDGLFE